jgi:hypothetical protein
MLTEPTRIVEGLLRQSAPFERVEDYIDSLPLDNEHRSALWLLAWSQTTNPAGRRRAEPRPRPVPVRPVRGRDRA